MSNEVFNDFEREKMAEIDRLKRELREANSTISTLRYDLGIARDAAAAQETGWHWQALSELDQAALPTPVRKLLKTLAEKRSF